MGGGIAQKGNVTRLNPSFNTIMYGSNSGIANSDMGAFGISPRYAHDWTTHATYTWGKSLDYLSSNNNGVGDGEAIFEAQHPKRQYTRSDYDSRHRFSVDAVRDIPGMHHNSFLHFGRSGFTVSPIIILQAKQAFSVYPSADYCSGGDYNGDGYNYDMSNIPILGRSLNVSRSDYLKGVFTKVQFAAPTPETQGNLGRNVYSGPGVAVQTSRYSALSS